MRHRRLVALLTSATMLHLSAVAGDAACATHASGHHGPTTSAAQPTAHATSMHRHAMPMTERVAASVSSAVPIAKSGAPPCEVPTQQHCCEALVGCNVDSAAATGPEVLAAAVIPVTQAHVAPDDAPASFAPAPEPPPPKA
jgi:hypothetical protein